MAIEHAVAVGEACEEGTADHTVCGPTAICLDGFCVGLCRAALEPLGRANHSDCAEGQTCTDVLGTPTYGACY